MAEGEGRPRGTRRRNSLGEPEELRGRMARGNRGNRRNRGNRERDDGSGNIGSQERRTARCISHITCTDIA